MADYLKPLQNFFGGAKPSSATPAADDSDFADFAGAPAPSETPAVAPSHAFSSSSLSTAAAPTGGLSGLTSFLNPAQPRKDVPYTRWYKVWERTSPRDFVQEAFIIPFILIIVAVHIWGTRTNRKKAKQWVASHAPILSQEFAVVGFGGRKASGLEDVQSESAELPGDLLKEKAANEYITYATGRQNTAFVDIKLTLLKRYNPLIQYGEAAMGFLFDSMPATEERMEATIYAFDGHEKDLVPKRQGDEGRGSEKSGFDGFVWAIVHKDMMKRLRDERYDLSLTSTKDHPKLPAWATVMSEASEITETLLTPEMIKAVEAAGESLEALVVTDMPMDQPKKLDELLPKKRISLSLRLPSNNDYSAQTPLFHAFLRLPDLLVSQAHFRPEVMRRVRQTREDEMRKIKRVDEGEKAEERKLEQDKKKKEERERKLKGLGAEEQRKFLEKEREKEQRKAGKRRTMRG